MYYFNKVLTSKIKNYYIEFEYSGLAYQTVVPYNEIVDSTITEEQRDTKGSKAVEIASNRTNFNNDFSVVEGGEDTKGTQSYNLGYTRNNKNEKIHDLSYERSGNALKLNYFYSSEKFKMNADTDTAKYYISDKFTYGSPTTPKVTEISNINLGLYEREQPDIALVQDIQNVIVKINGYSHRYDYDTRFVNKEENEDKYEVSVKDKYRGTYTRLLYQSDCEYENNGVNELEAYITYKITIRNQSTTLKTIINGIDCYFDSNYELVAVGSNLYTNGNISQMNNKIKYETVSNYGSGNSYKKTIIYNPDGISINATSNNEKNIYIQFKLNREALIKVINNEENLDCVSEIHSYSIKSGDNVYAGIDVDSNPNNCTPTEVNVFEDDTDSAPRLQIKSGKVAGKVRSISGIVFLDKEVQSGSGNIRQGNGQYDTGEKGIANVEVKLVKEDGTVAKMYKDEEWVDAKVITRSNGAYTISGYIPDKYKIVYTWGDKTYKVQDYKGTIYQEDDRQNNLEWYKDTTIRYSDALDSYDERLAIDAQTKIMNSANKQAIEKYDNAEIQTKENGTKETLITSMNSTTPVFEVGVEYNEAPSKVTEAEPQNRIGKVDFGIIKRAEQVVTLEKTIKSVKITLTDVSVLVNAVINEDGTIEGQPKYVNYVKKSNAEALFKIEVDQEIIQNAKLDVQYEFKMANKSEVDYKDENFYLYGEQPADSQKQSKMVSLKPDKIIDYLDTNLVSSDTANSNWKEIQTPDDITALGLSEEASESAKTSLKNGAVKILFKTLGQALKPVDNPSTLNIDDTTFSITLNCNKLLSIKDEEISENFAEIIKVTKNGGATLQTTPGNYIPANASTSEVDNSNSGSLQIIPPQGLTTDYIAYTILAISSLGILATGTVLIKKYVLK